MGALWKRAVSSVCGGKGQALIEYMFILILVAVVVILMVKVLGQTVNSTYSVINSSVPSP